MYLVIFSLAYYGMLRIGELGLGAHTVKACDVNIGMNKDKILLVLRTSKTHGLESKPQKIKIKRNGNPIERFTCPFKLACNYMTARRGFITHKEHFVIFADGSPVPTEQLRKVLKTAIDKIGLQAELYNLHSLRAGRSVDMLKAGYSLSWICEAGR